MQEPSTWLEAGSHVAKTRLVKFGQFVLDMVMPTPIAMAAVEEGDEIHFSW